MRILFIEPSGAGGIAHCTYALAQALGQRGIFCEILTGYRWQDRPLPDTVRVHRVFNGKRTNPLRLWSICYRLRNQIDRVHWQCATYPRLILALMRVIPLKSIPWVYTVHNVLPHELQESSYGLYEKTYRRIQGFIFHTQHSQRTFQKHFAHISVAQAIIPLGEYSFLLNGIHEPNSDGTVQLAPSTDFPRILFFGNIRLYKGLDILIRALAEVRREIPDVRLLIAGQAMGSFELYENLIDELNLQSCVDTCFGYIPDEEIPALLDSAAIAALPYRDIDQSAALMLMLAHGKATVATRVGGIPEVIQDGQTGLLVPPEDPSALASAIIDLLQNPSKSQRLGLNAYRDARSRFSWAHIAEQTEAFYRAMQNSRDVTTSPLQPDGRVVREKDE